MLDTFTIDTFSEGDTLKVYYGDVEFIMLDVIRISKGKYKQPDTYREPFSLRLKGPKELFLPQDTYTVEHEKLGTFELFIVPTMPLPEEKGSHVYQVGFS